MERVVYNELLLLLHPRRESLRGLEAHKGLILLVVLLVRYVELLLRDCALELTRNENGTFGSDLAPRCRRRVREMLESVQILIFISKVMF